MRTGLWGVWVVACSIGVGYAAEPTIEKTFEADRIIEYAVSLDDGDAMHRLHATMRKSDGAIWIKYTPPQPVGSFDALAPALTRLIRAADTINPGRISSLLAFEYFDCQEMILDAAVAFKQNPAWQAFLKARNPGAPRPSHRAVIRQLRRAKVFQPVEAMFESLGYCAHLSRFEKLAVRPIGPVIDEKRLAKRGLVSTQEIPVPLVLQFSTTPAKDAGPCPESDKR